jgi:hypothetical protein
VDSPSDTAVGVGKGVVNLIPDMWNLLVMGSKYTGPVSPAMQADVINYGAMQAYQSGDTARANAMAGYASEMMSSGYVGNIFDMNNGAEKGGGVLSMLIPVGAVAKGLGTGAKLMRGAKTVEVAETARVAETAVARTTGEAANANKPIQVPIAGVAINALPVVRIGRWMTKAVYEAMKKTGRVQNGAGDATYGATSGPGSFGKQAAPGSVYVEYDVLAKNVIPGSKPDWVMTIGPNANNLQKWQLARQGGEFSPQFTNISGITSVPTLRTGFAV